MNISHNNNQHTIQNQNGRISITGNSNRILIRASTLIISITGNLNRLNIQNSRVTLTINGNLNHFQLIDSQVNFGFNGNRNELHSDQISRLNLQYCNGLGNTYPLQPQQRERNQRNQRPPQHNQRSPNNQINRGQSLNRNPPRRGLQNRGSLNNNMQQRQQRQNLPVNFEMNFQQMMVPQMILFNQIFNNGGIRFQNQDQRQPRNVNIILREEENQQSFDEADNRGLTRNQVEMLPKTVHTGKQSKCTICLCDIEQGQQQTFLVCIHNFHWNCIRQWMIKNAKCPVCQHDHREYLRASM